MLSHFMSKSSDKCQPFFQILKNAFQWDAHCEEAFTALKTYLSSPPILVSPSEGELLTLYLAISDFSTSAALVKERDRTQQFGLLLQLSSERSRGKVSEDGKASSSIGDHRQKISAILPRPHY